MKIGAIGIRTKIIVGDAATWYLVKKYVDGKVVGGIDDVPEELKKYVRVLDSWVDVTAELDKLAEYPELTGNPNKFVSDDGTAKEIEHERLTDKNSEAAFQHVDTTVTKETLADNDKVALFDSESGKVVLTEKEKLQTDLTTVSQSITNLQNEKANKTQEGWITPTLLNGWRAHDFVSGILFRKDDFGNVTIRGMVAGGTVTIGTVLFNLPNGYRPPINFFVGIMAADNFAEVRILKNGDVELHKVSSVWTSLDGLIFPTT